MQLKCLFVCSRLLVHLDAMYKQVVAPHAGLAHSG